MLELLELRDKMMKAKELVVTNKVSSLAGRSKHDVALGIQIAIDVVNEKIQLVEEQDERRANESMGDS